LRVNQETNLKVPWGSRVREVFQQSNHARVRTLTFKSLFSNLQREQVIAGAAYLARRLAFGILILMAISFLSHFGLGMARGMALEEAFSRAIPRTLESLGRVVRGDLGLSPSASSNINPLPVSQVLRGTLSKSLGLMGLSLVIASVVGVLIGTWAAHTRRSGLSLVMILGSIIGVSIPSFFAALLLQMLVLRITRIVGHPILPVGGFGWDTHLILPALVLAARPIAQIARVSFVTVGEVLDQDYVRTAHSKGLPDRAVMLRHVMQNAAVPIITTLGLSLRFTLSSLPVVEFFFSWPGLGFTLLKAISQQDDNLTVALVMCLGVIFILINLIVDLFYRLLDPRLRETDGRVGLAERAGMREILRTVKAYLSDFVAYNPITNWKERRKGESSLPALTSVLRDDVNGFGEFSDSRDTRRMWLRETLGNFPFMLGTILVVCILVIFFFGARLSPHSPYTTRGLTVVEGEYYVPPFQPDEVFPWGTDVLGRDIMSLILAGAFQTFRLAAAVVAARMFVGFILGAIAGWNSGGWVDRVIMGLAEIISAFPALLLAMTLILALGIREGFGPFVIALCFVGWGEAMQYVRGEVMAMKPKTFIESAFAVGVRTPHIIMKHILPNLVPALISLTALEMGAVLMLLGELGFVGIFIGGGAFAELDVASAPFHYSDVPEWGALLSNVRHYARAYPWTALYPAVGFFVAILGFNLFGEGIRRMVEGVGVHISRLVNRYTVSLAIAGVVALTWIQGATGSIVYYKGQAEAFNGQRALQDIQALTDPAVEGRALGTVGLDVAASWIAQRFESIGLQAAGEKYSYYQYRERSYETLETPPSFVINDGGRALVYGQDFAEFPGIERNMGIGMGNVRFIAFGELSRSTYFASYLALEDIDYSGEIVMVLSGREASMMHEISHAGVLVVAANERELARLHTLSSRDPTTMIYGTARPVGLVTPMLWITEETANRILQGTGQTVADLRLMKEDLTREKIFEFPTTTEAAMVVQGEITERQPIVNIIGHLPGVAGVGGSKLDQRLIVVLAQYDNPPAKPFDPPMQGANDNASSVAAMMEVLRTMQETGYQPYKTFLFVAYCGEGLDGGNPVRPLDVSNYLQSKLGFSTSFEVEAIVQLRGLGAGDGEGLVMSSGGSLRLANLLETAARQMGVAVERTGDDVDISVVFEQGSAFDSGEEAPSLGLSYAGWEASSRTALDTLENISVEKLEESGRVLSLALMILGRETQY
jgi:peptide/nickel transport system permease protein